MLRRILTLVVAVLVINLASGATVFGQSKKDEKEAKSLRELKAKIVKLGTGEDAKVTVKLRDKRKLKGYVSQINDDGFVITNKDTGQVTDVPYAEVGQLKGSNKMNRVLVYYGIAVLSLVIVAIIAALASDDF